MAKDPAFLFYPNDYLGGTMGMTFEEKGAYIELLMLQFNRGHMTEHMIGQTVGQLWGQIKDKFIQDEQGLYYNARLQEEQIKRAKFTESRRNNKEGKNQYTKNKPIKRGHMTSHMENENVNENIDSKLLIDTCIEIAKKDSTWMDHNGNPTNKLFLEFKQHLTRTGEATKTPIDFKKHFSNWKKKQQPEAEQKPQRLVL